MVVGENDACKGLTTAFRRPYVIGSDPKKIRNSILLTGSNGTGRHQMVTSMATLLKQYGLTVSGEVITLDMSRYQSSSQEIMFLQDIYAALYGTNPIIIVEKFEEANTPINASFLDSVALSNSFTEYFPEVIQDDILEVAYPTMLKAYICDRLQGLVEESELDDVDNLEVDDLLEVSDKIAELDDEELAQLAEEEESSL